MHTMTWETPRIAPVELHSLNSFGRNVVARAIASGGTMPAAITAAMIRRLAGSAMDNPAVAKA